MLGDSFASQPKNIDLYRDYYLILQDVSLPEQITAWFRKGIIPQNVFHSGLGIIVSSAQAITPS